jgi:hypothetical protein
LNVTADGSISMHVKINRDEPDFNQTSARGDPTILKREAETDLLVMDGHTAVIAASTRAPLAETSTRYLSSAIFRSSASSSSTAARATPAASSSSSSRRAS